MSTWDDVVTTALLGTDRRPVPDDLPSTWAGSAPSDEPARTILDLAAQHRAWSRAGTRLEVADPPPVAPASEEIDAPTRAQDLLGRLLEHPHPSLINSWLAACAGRGLLVSAEHWQPLAVLAARNLDYDRFLLARALGDRGRWFLQQNPAWERLAAQITAAVSQPAPEAAKDPAESDEAAAWSSEIEAAFAGTDLSNSDSSTGSERQGTEGGSRVS